MIRIRREANRMGQRGGEKNGTEKYVVPFEKETKRTLFLNRRPIVF